MKYTYSFSPFYTGSDRIQKIILSFLTRIEVEMGEDEFNEFRIDCQRQDIELHEITRVPFHKAETVL